MSGPERKAPDDKLLEDFLEGRSPASRAWREAMRGESAPPELDDAVLGMAREEIKTAAARPASRDRFRDRRWPFALAAVLVLSFSTLLTIVQDPVAHKDAMMVAPDVVPTEAVILPEAAAPVAAAEVQAEAQQRQAFEAERKSMQAQRRMEDRPAKPSSAPAAADAAPSPGSYADAVQEPAASAASAGAEAEALSAPAPAAAPAVPPPPPAPVMEESREAAPAELKAAPAAELRRRVLSSDSLGAAKLKRESAVPEAALAELERIRRMLVEGREDEARRALEAWRKDWPERPVPADLQRLLD